jgi:hypothetical protein
MIQDPEVVQSDVDGQSMLMSIETGRYFSLSRIGTHIWKQLEQPCTESTIIAKLKLDFDVSDEQCERETKTFLQELRERRLICPAQ